MYEAIAFAMRYWFIFLMAVILIAVIVISVKEYKERKSVLDRIADFFGYLEIVGGSEDILGEKYGICEYNLIGTSSVCDICILDKGIKKKHAEIYLNEDSAVISSFGRAVVLVNDDMIKGPRTLKTGDVISIGNVSLRVFMKRKRVGNDY